MSEKIMRLNISIYPSDAARLRVMGGPGKGNVSEGIREALRQLDAARAEILRLEAVARQAIIEAINPDEGE